MSVIVLAVCQIHKMNKSLDLSSCYMLVANMAETSLCLAPYICIYIFFQVTLKKKLTFWKKYLVAVTVVECV